MKQKNINTIDYYLFIYLLFYFFQIIKAAVPDDVCSLGCKLVDKKCTHNSDYLETCPSYCVPDLVEGKCYSCGENLNSTIYYIFVVNENHRCGLGGSCGGNKLVLNTRQCVSQCYGQGTYNLYEMDGVCYTEKECGEGNRKLISNNKCDCIYLYSRTSYINKYLRHCYGEGELCGPEHTMYDLDTRICGTGGCATGKVKKYETRPRSTNILRCSTQCKSGEFKLNGYCLDDCPANTFRYNDPIEGYICVNSCSSYLNGYINGNKCVPICTDYIYDNRTCKSTCDRPFLYNEETKLDLSISKSKWEVIYVDSYESAYIAKRAIDGDPGTYWHSEYVNYLSQVPHTIVVDMGEAYNVSAFTYLARQDIQFTNGMVRIYDLYLSSDGITWINCVSNGLFEGIRTEQEVTISPPRISRYFKFVAKEEISKGPWTTVAELGIKAAPLRIHYCTKSCGSKYIEGESCTSTCSNGYYISTNNDNIKICVSSSGCYVKSYEVGYSNKYCYKSCIESGWPYYKGTTCYQSCPSDTPYHVEGQFECLSNCPTNYYLNGNTCYCKGLYAYTTSGNYRDKKCYADEAACKTAGYSYRKGNECLKQCAPNFELELDNTGSSFILKRCYNNKEECKSNGYYFYNSYKLICWSTCPYNMWSIELDNEGKPQEAITKSTCVDKCGKDYPKYTEGTKICKKECDNGQYYMLNETDKCIGECPYLYVGEDNECLEKCDNKKYYFSMDNGKYKCVTSCKNYGKFYVEDDPQCYDSCSRKNLYYYSNSDHKCVSSCLETTDQFHYGKMSVPQSCKNTNENNYYYENKTLVASCPLISEKGSFLCVESCGSKKINENYCVTSCPAEAPYFKREGNTDKCVNTCGTDYVVLFKNECIGTSCPAGYSANTTSTGKYCYPNCKFGEKFNIDSGSCVSTCPTGNNYYEKTTVYGSQEIIICRKSCMGINKFVKDTQDKECVSKCPENNNFITFKSNVCTSKCEGTQYFKFVENQPKATGNGNYEIYQCLDSCPTDLGYFYVKDNGIIKKNVIQLNVQKDLIILLKILKINLHAFHNAHQLIHII